MAACAPPRPRGYCCCPPPHVGSVGPHSVLPTPLVPPPALVARPHCAPRRCPCCAITPPRGCSPLCPPCPPRRSSLRVPVSPSPHSAVSPPCPLCPTWSHGVPACPVLSVSCPPHPCPSRPRVPPVPAPHPALPPSVPAPPLHPGAAVSGCRGNAWSIPAQVSAAGTGMGTGLPHSPPRGRRCCGAPCGARNGAVRGRVCAPRRVSGLGVGADRPHGTPRPGPRGLQAALWPAAGTTRWHRVQRGRRGHRPAGHAPR